MNTTPITCQNGSCPVCQFDRQEAAAEMAAAKMAYDKMAAEVAAEMAVQELTAELAVKERTLSEWQAAAKMAGTL